VVKDLMIEAAGNVFGGLVRKEAKHFLIERENPTRALPA
jgi:hypothetical protein